MYTIRKLFLSRFRIGGTQLSFFRHRYDMHVLHRWFDFALGCFVLCSKLGSFGFHRFHSVHYLFHLWLVSNSGEILSKELYSTGE